MKSTIAFILLISAALAANQWDQSNSGKSQSSWEGGERGSQSSFGGGRGRQQQGFGRSQGETGSGTRYGANIIDTPTMYGYEATIPGATSRFIKFRSEGRGGRTQAEFGGVGGNNQQWRQAQQGRSQSDGQSGAYGAELSGSQGNRGW